MKLTFKTQTYTTESAGCPKSEEWECGIMYRR